MRRGTICVAHSHWPPEVPVLPAPVQALQSGRSRLGRIRSGENRRQIRGARDEHLPFPDRLAIELLVDTLTPDERGVRFELDTDGPHKLGDGKLVHISSRSRGSEHLTTSFMLRGQGLEIGLP